MSRPSRPVVVKQCINGDIEVVDLTTATQTYVFEPQNLANFVRALEIEHPRWVWDDTTRWYPQLLAQGIRIKYCADLRLRHNILRHSPLIDQNLLVGDDIHRWDNFVGDSDESVLFAFDRDNGSLDSVAEYLRQQKAIASCTEASRMQVLLTAESTAALIAVEMSYVGLPWKREIHEQLLLDLLGPRPTLGSRPVKVEKLCSEIRHILSTPELNPDSPAELLRALQRNGLAISSTRSSELTRIDHPVVSLLLEYRRLQRLNTANGWRWLDTWVKAGRYRTTFVPGGVVSGRWAASGGGALSLPTQLRPAVAADDGWVFVVADVAQLEPRVLAGMSSDLAMAKAAQGIDLYQNLVDARVVDKREDAKLGMLGALYGATQGNSAAFVTRLAQRYPKAFGLVEAAARAGERGEVVHTFLGRGSPLPNADWVKGLDESDEKQKSDATDRRSWGRFTRNFVVQGTGAEWALCWMATLRNSLWELGLDVTIDQRPHLAFFLHDEIIVHTPQSFAERVATAIDDAAQKAGRILFGSFPIDFPLNTSTVKVYSDAK